MARYLKERKKKYLSRSSSNCLRSQSFLTNDAETVYLCKYSYLCDNKFTQCDDEKCSTCEDYLCKNTPESVKDDFKKILHNPALCGDEYPKLSALLWVLGGDLNDKKTENKKHSIKNWKDLIGYVKTVLLRKRTSLGS